MLATPTRAPTPEQTARACLRLARGDVTMARAAIERTLALAGRSANLRTRTMQQVDARATLAALDEITKES